MRPLMWPCRSGGATWAKRPRKMGEVAGVTWAKPGRHLGDVAGAFRAKQVRCVGEACGGKSGMSCKRMVYWWTKRGDFR